jgi:protein involved in polysaccharide export with SLBB domain
VDDAGQITLPALGRIQAAGLTLEEVETAVVERLTRLSDISSVRVVASVTEYRPLFVLGLVNNPGRYPYSAHTTVLKALAVAGGVGNPFYRRSAQATNPTDLVDRQERFDVATLQYWSALARRARLLAEQKKAETIEFPPDLIAKLNAIGEQGVMDREREIFEARRQTLANSLSVIAQQKEVVQQEIASAESYAEEVKKAIPPMQKELENLTALRDKGLTRRLEVLTVQRQVSDMQRETRTSALSITRGQRELNDLEKQASNLKGQREAEVAQALVEVGTEINVLKARLDNQSKLLPAGSSITTPTAQNAGEGETPVTFEIVRLNADGLAITMPASEDTLLMPGDVLKVVTVAPAGAGSAVSN